MHDTPGDEGMVDTKSAALRGYRRTAIRRYFVESYIRRESRDSVAGTQERWR